MVAVRVRSGAKRVVQASVAVAAIVLLTGCPPSQLVRRPLAEPPKAIGSLQTLFPTAVSPTYYEQLFVHPGIRGNEHLGYVAHFQLGDRWYVAYFDRHGKFECLREPDEELEAWRQRMMP